MARAIHHRYFVKTPDALQVAKIYRADGAAVPRIGSKLNVNPSHDHPHVEQQRPSQPRWVKCGVCPLFVSLLKLLGAATKLNDAELAMTLANPIRCSGQG